MSKTRGSKTDLLVGIAATVALMGIGYLLINYGMETTPSPVVAPVIPVPHRDLNEKRSDTIKPLPLIQFKSDTVYETDSAIMSQSAADRKQIRKEDSINKLKQ